MRGRRSISLLVCACALLCGLLGFGVSALGRPQERSSPATLQDQDERPFSLERAGGKTTVLSFMFSHCPSICPLQTLALKQVQARLPDSVRSRVAFVAVSVDPIRDTPAVLKDFAQRAGVDLGTWTFVTGSGVADLADRYHVEVTRDASGQIDHRAVVFLIDAQGRLAQTYTGSPIDRVRLAREIEIVARRVQSTGAAVVSDASEAP